MHDRIRIVIIGINDNGNVDNFKKIFPNYTTHEGTVASSYIFDVMEKSDCYKTIYKNNILTDWSNINL